MSSDEVVIEIRGFKGINLREPPAMVQDDELVSCINLDIGRAGELKKRTGFALLHTGSTIGPNQTKLIGHFLTPNYSQLIIQSGGNLYYSTDGITMTLIGAYDVEHGTQYVDKFYMVRSSGTVLEWNGVAATSIVGSPSGTFCLVYRDRLFVLNSEAATGLLNSTLYFSEINDFSATGWPSINNLLVRSGDGDFLTSMAVIHDLLIVFKAETTHALYVSGLPENWTLRDINPEIGCISKYTPREIEGFLYFVGTRGVYKTDGNIFEDISSSILELFEDRIVNGTNANIDTAAWWDDKYILLLHPTPSTQRYLVYHLRTGGWTEWVPTDILPSTFLEITTSNPTKGLYCGDLNTTGQIFRFGDGAFTDAGQTYDCSFVTKDYDFGMPSAMKRGKWVAIDCEGQGILNLNHIADGEGSLVSTSLSESRRVAHKLRGPGYFRTWMAEFSLVSNGDFLFHGMSFVVHKKRGITRTGV